MARACSGSRSSISSIDPLMSANSAVTVFRSPSRAEVLWASPTFTKDFGRAGADAAGSRAVAHWPQNLNPGGLSAWHLGHARANAAAHCPQNFVPAGFSKPHFEQRILVA